jgi:hypothetical protein
LETRQYRDVALQLADGLGAGAPTLGQISVRERHRDPCHGKEEARIHPIVAGPYAVAAEHAELRPQARRLRPAAAAQNVDHATNHIRGRRVLDPGRPDARAHLDAFAAARARIGHLVNSLGQGDIESHFRHTAPALCFRF